MSGNVVIPTPAEASPLLRYRLPVLRFTVRQGLEPVLATIWPILVVGKKDTAALKGVLATLNAAEATDASLRAALHLAAAALELWDGAADRAEKHARMSLKAWPVQTAARRVVVETAMRRGDTACAIEMLESMDFAEAPEPWDEPLDAAHRCTALSSLALRRGDIMQAAGHLARAYPGGPTLMPEELLPEWFRLSLNYDTPDEAMKAATHLILNLKPESADAVMQAILGRGWAAEALQLYRVAFSHAPANPLLRRRLIGLCIRTGAVQEARDLLKPYALEIVT